MFISDMAGSVTSASDWRDEHAATSTAIESALTIHDEATVSWEQAWIDLGGEG